MSERADVVVVGAGQAGLAVSHELTQAGVPHPVLERGRVGETWRGRWDSFCLVTPNWSMRLPGHHQEGDDPDGFVARDDIVAYLERQAEDAPVREGVDVVAPRPARTGGFELETSEGVLTAARVVLATAPTSASTGRRRPRRCPPTSSRSTSATTPPRPTCRPARCS